MLWKPGLFCGYQYVQLNAPGGDKPRRARSKRGHLPESSTTTVPSLWQARLAAAAAVGGIKVCGMVAISAEGAVALLRSGSC